VRAPEEPARTTRPEVRSLTVADERIVSAPETFKPPLKSTAPVTVRAPPTLTSVNVPMPTFNASISAVPSINRFLH